MWLSNFQTQQTLTSIRVSESAESLRREPNTVEGQSDVSGLDPGSLWSAITQTKGVGVSITDSEGRLIFVNDSAKVLFSEDANVDYRGKNIRDFHPPEYCRERLELIRRVLDNQKPLVIQHIYRGRNIHSTLWPIRDSQEPFHRVLVITRGASSLDRTDIPEAESVESEYIGLGALSDLTRRELEVAVLLGHGMSVPKVAKMLHRSPKTIERHKSSITQKLHLHGQAELVAVVTEMGLEFDDTRRKRFPKTE